MINRQLLAIIGKRFPAVYDVIPRGPFSQVLSGRLAEVALNPQPLPPHELGAAVGSEFIRTAWLADRFGLDAGLAFEDLDDWCPTRPKKLVFPPTWGPTPQPEPHPNWFTEFHLGFAARLAVVSEQSRSTQLQATLDKAIDRSLESMESAMSSEHT